MKAGKILLVDDEKDLLEVLGDFLEEEDFVVDTACDGIDALEKLEQNSDYDLVLSDINMPRMKGFELIKNVREKYPELKTALITAYDINDYVQYAQEYNVGNIIAKTSPFNFNDFFVTVSGIISGDVFGLDRHFSEDSNKNKYVIKHSSDIEDVVKEISEIAKDYSKLSRLKTGMREVIVNAVFYGARDEDGAKKEKWELDVSLEIDKYVEVSCYRDKEKLAVSVLDKAGRLSKKDILFWLERNITRDETGMVKSLNDEHGRGIFITREFVDRLVINIIPGKQSEVILMNYFDENSFKGFKPLIINEV